MSLPVRGIGRCRPTVLWAISTVLLVAAPLHAVHLRGQILRVGYSGSSSDTFIGSGDVYRIGRWVPVCVELSNDDGDQFEGRIEVRQIDADGDEVVASREVAVRGMRQFNLYVPAGPKPEGSLAGGMISQETSPFVVRVFDREGRLAKLHDDRGEPVRELRPPRELIAASADAVLILDIGKVNQLDELKRVQHFVVMRCSPSDIPDHFSGLDFLDVIVWDAPDPGSLDPLQNDALIEWVRRGGRLILGVSRTWNNLTQSKFGPILPARLSGTDSVSDRKALDELLGEAGQDETANLMQALTYCPVTLADLPSDAVPVRPRFPKPEDQIWVVRRPCGRGEVVLVTGELRELLSRYGQDENPTLLRSTLLRLRPASEAQNVYPGFSGTVDLFTRVAAQTAFQTTSGLYFAFAFAFVIAYIVVVTGGTWGWLRRRGTVRHAWVASAVLAAGASGLSLAAVQVVRAWGQGVHEMSIVDGRAGTQDAVATSYLGLRTASHTLLDLCVPKSWVEPSEAPDQRGPIRPNAVEAGSPEQLNFSVPQRYESVAQLGELRSVPFRATLKQFTASWRGSLDGRLIASLRSRSTGDELDSFSYVENQLGTDLHDCYLFTRTREGFASVYTLPPLAQGARVTLGEVRRNMETQLKEKNASRLRALRERVESLTQEEQARPWSPPGLRVLLDQCLANLGVASTRGRNETSRDPDLVAANAPSYVAPLLLLSFYDDAALVGLLRDGQELARSQGRELEMSARLEAGTAVFIGFSDNPGPARLCRRKPGAEADAWKPIVPSRAAVMYRFTVPIVPLE